MQDIDKRNPKYRRRQLKTTTFSMAIFVAAALILSGFAGAFVIQGNTTQMNEQKEEGNQKLLPMVDSGSLNVAEQPLNRQSWLYYHTGQVTGVGFGGALLWQAAIRFTPTELAGYNGYSLSKVRFYAYDLNSVDNVIKIYDEGSPTGPGTLLTSESYTVTATGWNEVTLSSPPVIDDAKDMWVSIEMDQFASGFPMGADAGPQIREKGGWLYDGTNWVEIYTYPIDRNWCIEAYAEVLGPPPEDDVGIKSIDYPETGPAFDDMPVEVTVKNYGNSTAIDVPVKVEIGKLASTTVFSEGFESYTPSNPAFPAGWTLVQTNPQTWHSGYSSGYIRCLETGATGAQDELVYTQSFDFSTETTVTFYMGYHYKTSSDDDQIYILGSTDGGSTFPITLDSWTSTASSSGARTYDISSWAGGQSNVCLAWRFVSGPVNTGNDYYYFRSIQIYSPTVTYFDQYWFTEVTADDWGPNGWQSEEVVTVDPPDPNRWICADDTYATTPTNVDPYAGDWMAIYNTGLLYPQGASARLYTPPMDISGHSATVLLLKFMMHINNYGSSYTDHVDIQVSEDNTTWTTIESISSYDASNPGWMEQVVDLSAYASSTSLQLGFLGVDGGYRDIIIDEVSLEASYVIMEYLDIEYVSVPVGGEETVVFSDWTPNDWQNVENVVIDYGIVAQTIWADDNPANDMLSTTVSLTYPYLFDTELVSINNPPLARGVPGQTFPVEVTIKNVGQFPSCCYLTNMQIGSEATLVYIDEDFEGSWPPSGWTIHNPGTATWNTNTFYGRPNYAGTGQCADADSDAAGSGNTVAGELWTPSFSLATETSATLEFGADYNWLGGTEYFAVDVSIDGGTTWTNEIYWTEDHVSEHVVVDLTAYCGNSNVIIRFDYDDFGGWYWWILIDDVEVKGSIQVISEYDEDVAAVILDPGQSADLTFPAWTPDQLLTGTSATIDYILQATAYNVDDTNPANDQVIQTLEVDFWHDVLIQEITQPSIGRAGDLIFEQLVHTPAEGWSAGTSDTGGPYKLYENYAGLTDTIGEVHWWGLCLVYSAGWTPGNPDNLEFDIGFYTAGATPGTEVAYFADVTATYTATGDLYAGFPSYYWECVLPASVALSDGWISIQTQSGAQGLDWLLWMSAQTGDGYSYHEGASPPDRYYDQSLRMYSGAAAGGGHPPIEVWTQGGTEQIQAIVANEGTFGETGLNCSAEILEFISDPENGSSVYNDSFAPINLDPLGGTETCTFGSYNFAMEGPYGVYFELPLPPEGTDNIPNNNAKAIGVGIDKTAPTATHTLDPATPNGENQWYISDLTVTFTADDGEDAWDSGVKEIKYRVDGGTVQTITGSTGTYTHTDDGENIEIEYWAVDNVENAGIPVTFDFDMDQTVPDIDISYEVTGGSALEGWDFVFTATATDDTSGMDRVEFYLNDVLQDTVPGPGPTYQWGFKYYGGLSITIKATAIDEAGLDASAQVVDPESSSHSQSIPSNVVVKKVVGLGQI